MKHLMDETWKARYERLKSLLFVFTLYTSLFVVFPSGLADGTWFEKLSSVTGSKALGAYYFVSGIYAAELMSGLLNAYDHRLLRVYPSWKEAFFDACVGLAALVVTTVLFYFAGGFKYVEFPQYLLVLVFPTYWLGKNLWWWYRAR